MKRKRYLVNCGIPVDGIKLMYYSINMKDTSLEIQKLLNQGYLRSEVADILGISKAAVSWQCKKLGLPTVSSRWSVEELSVIDKLYRTTDIQTLKELLPGRSLYSIRRIGSERGIKKDGNVWKTKPKSELGILLNRSLISNYYIGYLLADGCISGEISLSFSAEQKDEQYVKDLARYLKTKNQYKNVTCNNHLNSKSKSSSIQVQCSDSEIVPQIVELYDIRQKKTYNPPCIVTYDKFLNEEIVSILIGFIDGDGNLEFNRDRRSYRMSLECHKVWMPFLEYIVSRVLAYFKIDCNIKLYPRKGRNTAVCRVNSKELLILLRNYSEENNLPVLSRKWDKVKVSN